MRKQSKEYKLKLKQQKQILEQVPQQEEIIQPVVQELEVEVLEGQRRCKNCGEVKDIKTGFYSKRFKCITCVREYELRVRTEINTKYKMDNGGSERVPQKPGVYADEYQEAQVTEFLTLVGWKLNPNGVWSKKGFKTKDKVWEKPIKKLKRIGNKNQNGSERSPVYHKRLELIELKQKGMTYQKIGDIYDISPATVMRIINDLYDKK
jgi:transposase-like protein